MRSSLRLLAALAAALAALALAAVSNGDPGESHADDITVPAPTQPAAPPGTSSNVKLLDAVDNDGTINSDLAFYRDLAFVGYYDGFKIVDIAKPKKLRVLSDTKCRANQGDLSVFKARNGRLYMLQSIDRPVSAPDCSGTDTDNDPATAGAQLISEQDEFGIPRDRARFGYEGLRLFDVTNPRKPKFVRFFRTECGSHTHTLVPGGSKLHAYIASYPLGSHITPQVDYDAAGDLRCDAPHQKISIVSMPLGNPSAGTVKTKALSSDTEPYDPDGPTVRHEHDGTVEYHGAQPAFISCHDHQAFLRRNIVVAACAGDLQYWDVTDRGDPSSADGEAHTHIQREVREDDPSTPDWNERWESFDFMHNSTVTWDGKVVGAVDESGGGVEPRCDGDETKRGFTWFYPLVKPGTPVDGFDELGRYITPRPQGTEVCVAHNGNVLPLRGDRYQQVQGYYSAGNSWLDFSNPGAADEIGWADVESDLGAADSWSTYWYNDVMYANGGLNRRGATANRGFEAYALYDEEGDRVNTRDWKWLNPQTQEEWQHPKGKGKGKD